MRIFWDDSKAREWIASLAHSAATGDAAACDCDDRGSPMPEIKLAALDTPPYRVETAILGLKAEDKPDAEWKDGLAALADPHKALAPAKVGRPPRPETEKVKPPPKIQLSAEQEEAKRLAVLGGSSLFITGGAGTGKSVLIREIVKAFQAKDYEIAVTATTGIAGLNIQGSTIHSWAGIGLGNGTPRMLAEKISSKRDLVWRWRRVEVLVIDEVSMLDALLFDKLEAVARAVRKDPRPFGGIQLILCGDFFQLPPVVVETRSNGHLDPELEQKKAYLLKRGSYRSNFVFDALSWSNCVPRTIALKRVFRQTEKDLVHHLDCLRRGRTDPDIVRFLTALDRPIDCSDGIMPTELFSKKKEVEAANVARLQALHGFPYSFKADDVVNPACLERIAEAERSRFAGIYLSELKRSTIAPDWIELRAGAQVMLTKNLTNGLVNGSVGVIVAFASLDDHEVARDHNGNLWFRREGHKGRVQIAQSAVGSKNRAVTDFAAKVDCKPKAKEPDASALPLFAARVKEVSDDSLRSSRKWPVVRFSKGLARDESIEMLVPSMPFDFESAVSGKTVATRKQVPLILAWAVSIHKGQGQTLPRVKVNLGSVFESGQAYVALSRATCVEGLQVLNFSAEKIFAEERVIEWYRELEEEQGRNKREGSGSEEQESEPTTSKVEAEAGAVAKPGADEEVVEIKKEDFYTAAAPHEQAPEVIVIPDSQPMQAIQCC
ncbi:uncharacterized protein PSFLO_01161 [Pseudozyma flocculosa]|nr:uncharacterized protein PSFLO_01161 [Pseudozyma flocculosa]